MRKCKTLYRRNTEKYIFNVKERYLLTSTLYLVFILRLVWKQGYYAIAYLLGKLIKTGLFLLQCTISFFTPLGGPDLEDDFIYEDLPV